MNDQWESSREMEMYRLGQKHKKDAVLTDVMIAALESRKQEVIDFARAFVKQQEEK